MQTISEYLIMRLNELGADSVFGVPGDYNFNLVEAVQGNGNMKWVATANELNAAYAADGYAREKGIAALITTYGVGELSAINGVAGSYAELLPVVHIGGIARQSWINSGKIFHHCLNYDYDVFRKIYSNVTSYATILTVENAQEEIEKDLYFAFSFKRPVYIGIYDDLAIEEIQITTEKFSLPKSDELNLYEVATKINELMQNAKNPLVISELPILRFNLQDKMSEFLKKTNCLYATMVMGKSSVDENSKNFIGTLTGKLSCEKTYKIYKNSDLILGFGVLQTDFNTGGYTTEFDCGKFIDIGVNCVKIDDKTYKNVLITDLLDELIKIAKPVANKNIRVDFGYKKDKISCDMLSQEFIYSYVQDFLTGNDTLISETGLTNFGSIAMKLPTGAKLFSQALWGSIGWATPAALGAAIANKSRRVILLTGEGSHQMTAQETASFERYNVNPIVIVVNNNGYTIERYLTKDPMNKLNDISDWDYSLFARALTKCADIYRVKTKNEFKIALQNARKSGKFTYIEAFTPIMDAPEFAKKLTKKVTPIHSK